MVGYNVAKVVGAPRPGVF